MASPPVNPNSSATAENPESSQPRRIDIVEPDVNSGFNRLKRWRNNRRPAHALKDWPHRQPYHQYVHQLVEAGWENLLELDTYLHDAPSRQPGVVVSVLDICPDFKKKLWPDINSERDLRRFMEEPNRQGAKVRLYLAEYSQTPATCIIECLGAALKLDPRFFIWSIGSRSHVFTPSQKHRAPYIDLGFGVLNMRTDRKTDADMFRVLVYVQPDESGDGWTGVVLFSSHTKINLSPRIVTDPPRFSSQVPPPHRQEPKSFRQLYIESFEFLDLRKATESPFYAISTLLRLNFFCWNQVILAIREEDQRINGISDTDTTVGHAEDIQKSLAVVRRGGSLGWKRGDDAKTKEVQESLEEDFKHLVEQTDFLWETRKKMASIRQRASETRWTSLTNAFTYIFAPVTIISGVYGMNVSQITGTSSNPNIWQFFVAVAVFNLTLLTALAISKWIHIQIRNGRAAGMKEVVGFAVGS